jgi:hypothetical protein
MANLFASVSSYGCSTVVPAANGLQGQRAALLEGTAGRLEPRSMARHIFRTMGSSGQTFALSLTREQLRIGLFSHLR